MPLSDELKADLLRSISLRGDGSVNPIIGSASHVSQILNVSSGLPKILNPSKFSLVVNQPLSLSALNSLEIRCCLCRNVISYPAWYRIDVYLKNTFHFFICFDTTSSSKPTARCYRR
jgi:hypothetical protein